MQVNCFKQHERLILSNHVHITVYIIAYNVKIMTNCVLLMQVSCVSQISNYNYEETKLVIMWYVHRITNLVF